MLLPYHIPCFFWVNYVLKLVSSGLIMKTLFPMLVFYLLKTSFSLSQYKHVFDSPCYPTCLFKHHPIPSPFHLKALQSLPVLFFYWNCFSTSSFLSYHLLLTHLITCLEIWCSLGSCHYLLYFNHFSSMSFGLIPSIPGFWGNSFIPLL